MAIVYSLPSSQRIPWIHSFSLDANIGQFLSLLVSFKNTKTSRHSEIKQTRQSTKQDFSGEALSKQNTEASLASLSCNSSWAPTEWSAIFAFDVYMYIRAKCRVPPYRKALRNFYKICCNSSLDLILTCLARVDISKILHSSDTVIWRSVPTVCRQILMLVLLFSIQSTKTELPRRKICD